MANLPGLPILAAGLTALFTQPAALFSDGVQALLGFGATEWGIFDQGGQPVIIPDNIMAVEYKRAWVISDYPIEQGDFSSYNKVTVPFVSIVRMSLGGSLIDRADFLATMEEVAASLDLYNIVMPEITQLNANIEGFDYQRADGNAGLIVVDVRLVEIRQIATATFSQTAQPNGAGQVNGGQVQGTAPSQNQQSAISSLQ